MTNATLEPATFQSSAPAEAPTDVAEMPRRPAAPDTGIGRLDVDRRAKREITQPTPIQGKKRNLLTRSFYLLKDASFQLGLSGPGKLWYKESQVLNAKDKAVLNQALHGFL